MTKFEAKPPAISSIQNLKTAKNLVAKLVRRASQVVFWWRGQVQGRHGRLCLERLAGLDLVILPEVFNPALFGSSLFLARYLQKNYKLTAANRILDLGCGSGLLGLVAAQMGATVTACDVNPAAVKATKINASLNGLEANVTVREGDLFAPVAGQNFDIILNNPPYYAKTAANNLEKAFFAGANQEVLRSILRELHRYLAPNGAALLVVSNTIGFEKLVATTDLGGLRWQKVAEQRWWAEKQQIYEFRR